MIRVSANVQSFYREYKIIPLIFHMASPDTAEIVDVRKLNTIQSRNGLLYISHEGLVIFYAGIGYYLKRGDDSARILNIGNIHFDDSCEPLIRDIFGLAKKLDIMFTGVHVDDLLHRIVHQRISTDAIIAFEVMDKFRNYIDAFNPYSDTVVAKYFIFK